MGDFCGVYLYVKHILYLFSIMLSIYVLLLLKPVFSHVFFERFCVQMTTLSKWSPFTRIHKNLGNITERIVFGGHLYNAYVICRQLKIHPCTNVYWSLSWISGNLSAAERASEGQTARAARLMSFHNLEEVSLTSGTRRQVNCVWHVWLIAHRCPCTDNTSIQEGCRGSECAVLQLLCKDACSML